jgi:hypothetical protein
MDKRSLVMSIASDAAPPVSEAPIDSYFRAVVEVNRLSVELSKLRSDVWPGTKDEAQVPEIEHALLEARGRRDQELRRLQPPPRP